MVNRIIKKREGIGVKTSADDIIREFLREGGKMFGEIWKYLGDQGVKYSKKRIASQTQ